MAIKFVHTSDWQIGKSFGRFPEDVQGVLRSARLEVIHKIADVADDFGARHVLVAGDIYDSEALGEETLRKPLTAMAGYPNLAWHLLPGNHDPARPGGIWDRVRRTNPSGNIIVHTKSEPVSLSDEAVLLPAPLSTKQTSNDPTAWMDKAVTPSDVLRIGLAHGSIGRYGTEGHASVPLEPDRARHANLDYLALGDDHGLKCIDERTWFSGTPEPDGWRQNDPGNVLCVALEGREVQPEVTPVRTGAHAWGAFDVAVSDDGAMVGVAEQIKQLPVASRRCIVRLTLQGALSLNAKSALDRHTSELASRLLHLDADLAALRQTATVDDLSAFPEGSEIQKVALRLQHLANEADTADTAHRALGELLARYEVLAEQ